MNSIDKFNQDNLAIHVEECARALMSITEIAQYCMIDVDDLREKIRNTSSQISYAYYKGKADTLKELKEKNIELAMKCAPQAVLLANEYINTMNDDENI